MKMEGRDSAECQNWEKMDTYGIFDMRLDILVLERESVASL